MSGHTHIHTYVRTYTHTHIHTHRTTTVTLAAHVRRGLTRDISEQSYSFCISHSMVGTVYIGIAMVYQHQAHT